jgi:hypothetical protein
MNNSLEESKKCLRKNDKDTLEKRAELFLKIPSMQVDGRIFLSQRETDYASEAIDSFINGNFRSTILCSACAIDQIFRYEYFKSLNVGYEEE